MYKIVLKEELAPGIKLFEVKAPLVAKAAQPGHFIILRIHEKGERIPLTIYDFNRQRGAVSIVFQEVGKTTKELGTLEVGDEILDFLGPLGRPAEIHNYGQVVAVGGGVGIAPLYPEVRALKAAGNRIISIIGARTKELLILEDRMRKVSDELWVTTDDGTYGYHGFVTELLAKLLSEGGRFDLVIAIGPLPMMKAACQVTKSYNIKTIVSLNPIMVDGTGMCGCCRVSVGGESKFSCVHGPEFDGHLVDFDELLKRQNRFLKEERLSLEIYERRAG